MPGSHTNNSWSSLKNKYQLLAGEQTEKAPKVEGRLQVN
jgi:hypothetical protein